jgi:hypothetical protein
MRRHRTISIVVVDSNVLKGRFLKPVAGEIDDDRGPGSGLEKELRAACRERDVPEWLRQVACIEGTEPPQSATVRKTRRREEHGLPSPDDPDGNQIQGLIGL